MDTNLDDIAKIVAIAKPVVEPFIKTLIKPQIKALSKWLEDQHIKTKVADDFFENKFTDYLSMTLERCTHVNLLIFQNHQIKLEQIYFPLTIISSKDHKSFKFNGFNKALFSNVKKILIADTAGMGKSTLSKWIAKLAIEENVAIPIVIELRNLSEDHTILDEIFFQFNPIDKDFDKDLIFKFIELGKFLIILDGFDEIRFKSAEVIIKDIRSFVNKSNNNWFVLTSRPEGALVAFGDFQSYNIKSLENNEPYELIKRYDSVAPVKISRSLAKDIKEKYEQVRELLGNPFLVSLLYSTYTYNKDIPGNKLAFYDEIYQALFKRHDLSKDGWTRPKHSNLDIQQFRIVLRQLAFDTVLLGETSYLETALVDLVSISIKKCPGVYAKPHEFINDIISTVPIFQKDGLKIRWAHKSFQDFFSAEYITFDSNKEYFLSNIYKSGPFSFLNVLDFISQLDFKTFRKIIVKNILTEFIEHYENAYNKSEFHRIKGDIIDLRKSKTFACSHYFLRGDGFLDSLLEKLHEQKDLKTHENISVKLRTLDIFYVCEASLKIAIIEILAQRKVKYIYECQNGDTDEADDFFQTLKLKTGNRYFVNDDRDNIFNSNKNFNQITKFLEIPGFTSRSFASFLINYDDAKKELKSIEKDISLDDNLRAFDSFLIS